MQVLHLNEKLHDYYNENNPQYSKIKIEDLTRLTEGWETIVYGFTLNYEYKDKPGQKNKKDLIIRFYPGSEGHQKATNEFNLMANLMMTTVPIPDPYRLEVESEEFDLPFVIMENIQGELLSSYILTHPKKRENLLTRFSNILVDIHTLDWKPIVHQTSNYSVRNPYQYIVQTMNQFKDKIEMFDKKEFIPVLRWLVEQMDTVPNDRLSLLHGDYHLANVIVDKQGEFHVIDWVKSTVGDFRVDLGWTLIIHETVVNKEVRDVILNSYRHFFDGEVSSIKYFEVLAILKQLLDLSINFEYRNETARLAPNRVDKMKENMDPIKRSLNLLYGHTRIKIPEFERLLG